MLTEKNLPLTNINNLIKQAANESAYGTSPRGSQGYNLGGIKWTPKSSKYKHSTYKDNQEYIDFDNLLDFARYKVDLLNSRYDALNVTDTTDFVNRLHGQNKTGSNYSASKNAYMIALNGMKSLDKALSKYK